MTETMLQSELCSTGERTLGRVFLMARCSPSTCGHFCSRRTLGHCCQTFTVCLQCSRFLCAEGFVNSSSWRCIHWNTDSGPVCDGSKTSSEKRGEADMTISWENPRTKDQQTVRQCSYSLPQECLPESPTGFPRADALGTPVVRRRGCWRTFQAGHAWLHNDLHLWGGGDKAASLKASCISSASSL